MDRIVAGFDIDHSLFFVDSRWQQSIMILYRHIGTLDHDAQMIIDRFHAFLGSS